MVTSAGRACPGKRETLTGEKRDAGTRGCGARGWIREDNEVWILEASLMIGANLIEANLILGANLIQANLMIEANPIEANLILGVN